MDLENLKLLCEVNNLGWTCYDCRHHDKLYCRKMPGRKTREIEEICAVAEACEFCSLYIGTCRISGVKKPATHRACGALDKMNDAMTCEDPRWEGQKCQCPACGECESEDGDSVCEDCYRGPVKVKCPPEKSEEEEDGGKAIGFY